METIEVPGHGIGIRLMPRGMSDYERIAIKTYQCKDVLWKCQFRGKTSKKFKTIQEALSQVE